MMFFTLKLSLHLPRHHQSGLARIFVVVWGLLKVTIPVDHDPFAHAVGKIESGS